MVMCSVHGDKSRHTQLRFEVHFEHYIRGAS